MRNIKQSLRQIVLNLLSENQKYVSGQELSKKLGVSRTTIWKHINSLRNRGYEIESVPNRGYRLIQSPAELIPEEIFRKLETTLLGQEIVFYKETDSTNTQAKNHAKDYPEGTIFLADTQSRGRGRLGRNWSSIPGKGIWCTVLLKPSLRPSVAAQFPLLTAVAITEALRQYGVKAVIKWPNDVLVEGKKICGILIEMGAELDQINFLVIGFGLNVKHQNFDFPEEIRSHVTSMEILLNNEIDRVELLSSILLQIEKRYFQFLKDGFAPILKRWKEYNCTLGINTKISRFNQPPLYGKALDLNYDGSLLLELKDGQIISVFSGEIPF